MVEDGNKTLMKEFILLAFSNTCVVQILLFVIILLAYIVSLTGNLSIIVLVTTEPLLQTPMYYFIGTLAVVEVMFVTDAIPKLLDNLIRNNKSISIPGCFIQLFFLSGLGMTECYLLTVMAFDRHLAINSPLHYLSIMKGQLFVVLNSVPWIAGFSISFFTTFFTARLDFCGQNVIDHFLCDLAPLQSLACSDPYISKVMTMFAGFVANIMPLVFIISCYIRIIITICKIRSTEGKKKAFSTCSSHLTVAAMFYLSASIVYSRPSGNQYDKYVSVLYTLCTPMMNPFIYTLRNKDVKLAARKSRIFRKILCYKQNLL